jgi:hypothetical protein
VGRVKVRLDSDVFTLLMTEGHETKTRCSYGLPVGAEFVSLARDPETHEFVLFYQDDAFAEVVSGATVPELRVKWEALDG